MSRRRDLVVVIALLALAATASFLLFGAGPDDAAPAPPPPEAKPAAAPVKGVRADAASRKARRSVQSPAADTVPKGPTGSLLVRVNGSVRGRDGLVPIEDASVYVIDATDTDWRAVTAAAGSARFDELPVGKTVVHVEVKGRKALDKTLSLVAGEETRVDVLAFVVGTVRGVVRDPDGRPVDGAWVQLAGSAAAGVVTNDDGGFAIVDASLGTSLTLTAGAPEWADAVPIEGIRLEGEPPSATCDIVLQRMSSVVLRIIDPAGQRVDAAVSLDRFVPLRHRGTGEYVCERIAPGAHTVTADSKEFPKATFSFTVAAGESADVAVRFEEGKSIEGVVTDANGAPVANAFVIASSVGGGKKRADGAVLMRRSARAMAGFETGAATAADGAFKLGRLVEGDYELTAASTSMTSTAATEVHAPATGVRIVVAALTRVRLRLVRPADAEPHGAVVVSECAPGSVPNRAGGTTRWVAMQRGASPTEADLTFSVSPDARALCVCGEGFAPVVVAIAPRSGELTDLGEVRVNAGLSLKGRVVTSDGKPVAGVEVTARLAEAELRGCKSGDDGTFVLEHLAPGPVVVRAFTDGLAGVAVLDVARDAPSADVVVRVVGVLKGSVRNADGTAAARVEVEIRDGLADAEDTTGNLRTVTTGSDGRFNTAVTAGRCLASAGGAAVRADVPEGGDATVTLTLEKP
jgi:protocatechuate 3,4-dioxygenase beta subunit